MNKKVKFVVPILALILIFSFALACNGTSDQKEKEYTTEYKLAVIDKGGYLEEYDPIVSEYKIVLDNLKSKVINDEMEIADTVVKAQEILREEHQINLQILKIMKDLDASIPEDIKNLDLVEITSAYIVLLVSE